MTLKDELGLFLSWEGIPNVESWNEGELIIRDEDYHVHHYDEEDYNIDDVYSEEYCDKN